MLAITALALVVPSVATTSRPTATVPARPAAPAVARATCSPSPAPGVRMSEAIRGQAGHRRSTGTLRALTLMIDFPDARGAGSARGRFAEFFPQTAQWYRTSSYGALDYRASAPVKSWIRMPHTFASYGIKRGVGYDPGYRKLVRDIAKAAEGRVDFGKYDLLNVLVTPNAGPSALHTVLSVTFTGMTEAPKADGVPLSDVSFVYGRQEDGSATAKANAYRVLPHENAHVLGLPDLYTADSGSSRVGHWDLMSETWGPGNDVLGWHKRRLGWLDGEQVSCVNGSGDETRTIAPLSGAGEDRSGRHRATRLVYVPATDTTGYALEVRTQEGNDEAVCKPGVLVYWIDTGAESGDGPVTVRDSSPHSGGCSHQPNMNAELSDAPFAVGEGMTDERTGISVAVTGHDRASGGYRVRISRP